MTAQPHNRFGFCVVVAEFAVNGNQLSIQRQMVMTRTFYFMLCQSSLLSTVISFVYKEKWWFDESMSVIFCMKIFEKEFLYSLSTLN